ncbi:MAG: aldo/keto reductase [Clostridia bacterium]|nr:aldo/keto reductase [Clostridia bacterium]
MEYTSFGKLNERVSRLGFGCMRLPVTAEGKIDEPRAAAMFDTAIKAGVNYFDTAYFYHNHTSEAFVGKALKAYPRESYYLATKLPLSEIESLEDAVRIFEGQFETMQVEYFDFYLLHCVNAKRWEMLLENGILDLMLEEQKKGRIRRLGFSFHDSYEVFERVLTYRDWDFCQIQLNYMDINVQAGMKGYDLATKLGIPVIVMEPVKGGNLATLSEDIAQKFYKARPDWSVASWAMRWVATLDNCKLILSGMSTEEQVEDNLNTFAHVQKLTQEELEVIDEVRREIEARTFVACTACKYCMPCPFGVDIPDNFEMMNDYARYNHEARLNMAWNNMKQEERAANCRSCGQCEKACPQQLPIREKLHAIAATLEKK